MRKILILAGRYLPGYKDGGPLRTLINLTDALGDEYEFYIACFDRDQGETQPYTDILGIKLEKQRYGMFNQVVLLKNCFLIWRKIKILYI